MASARIERHEFPVHRNRTLKTLSGVFSLMLVSFSGAASLGRAALAGDREERGADLRRAAAAVFHEEGEQLAHRVVVGVVDDRPAVPARADQAGVTEDVE